MSHADYADDRVPFTNTPIKAESMLHCQEQAVGLFSFYVNANETEFMSFIQERAISNSSGNPSKINPSILMVMSTYRLAKTQNAIDRLSIIWKFNQSDKKRDFIKY